MMLADIAVLQTRLPLVDRELLAWAWRHALPLTQGDPPLPPPSRSSMTLHDGRRICLIGMVAGEEIAMTALCVRLIQGRIAEALQQMRLLLLQAKSVIAQTEGVA